jgi:hypothetical protein
MMSKAIALSKLFLLLLCLTFAFSNVSEARNCVKGKACGNSCIAKNDVCHKGAGDQKPTPAAEPAAAAAAPVAAKEPAKEVKAEKAAPTAKNCKKGKACGNTCIPKDAVCHA